MSVIGRLFREGSKNNYKRFSKASIFKGFSMLSRDIILSKIFIQDVHHILGILSVNSFVVHDGGSDETSTDLIGTNLCGRLNVKNKSIGPLFGKWQLTL